MDDGGNATSREMNPRMRDVHHVGLLLFVRPRRRLNGAGNHEPPHTPRARDAWEGLESGRSGYAWIAAHAPRGRRSPSPVPRFGTKGSQVRILSPRPSKSAADPKGYSS